MIDLDTLSRLVIVLAPLVVIPVLLALGWVARRVRHSSSAVLLRSWWRGHRRRSRHRRRSITAPAGWDGF
ncbi:MAG: hypothetical protein ACT4NY_19285 [Pseudonocardiales bacterium]